MLDFTMAMLCLAYFEDGYLIATTDLHTQFTAPGFLGAYRCNSRFVRKGSRTMFTQANLFSEDDRMIASGIATNLVIPPE